MTQPRDEMVEPRHPWWRSMGDAQPEIGALIAAGRGHGEVLDAGGGHAATARHVAARGFTTVGPDSARVEVAA